MMKKTALYIFLFFVLCNLPIVSPALTALFVDMHGIPVGYVTKDLHFYARGGLDMIKSSEIYERYKEKYPYSDHTLYRATIEKNYLWFWRYGEYMIKPNWRAPYIQLPPNFSAVPYYGRGQNDNPEYKWDDETEDWMRIDKGMN